MYLPKHVKFEGPNCLFANEMPATRTDSDHNCQLFIHSLPQVPPAPRKSASAKFVRADGQYPSLSKSRSIRPRKRTTRHPRASHHPPPTTRYPKSMRQVAVVGIGKTPFGAFPDR